jgi:predicted RNase H-like nuclease (RuvC/YqgF family)
MEFVQGMAGTKSVLDGVLALLRLPMEPTHPGDPCIIAVKAQFKPVLPHFRKKTKRIDVVIDVITHQLTVHDGVRTFDLLDDAPTRVRPVLVESKDLVKELRNKVATLKEQADALQLFNDSLETQVADLQNERASMKSELQIEVDKAGLIQHLTETKTRCRGGHQQKAGSVTRPPFTNLKKQWHTEGS